MKGRSLLRLGLSLVGSVSIIVSGSFFLDPTVAKADEVYVNKNCQVTQNLAQYDRYTVFYTSKFVAREQSYVFYAARYQDGAGILCTLNVKQNRFQVVNLSQVRNQFIRKVTKDSSRDSVFLVSVAEGNGLRVNILDYRLDLSNPEKPILTFLRKRRE